MPRGRKVNSNGERSKQLLLEKAVELFSTHGYHETKISDIVKAANLTQPTFYLYFQSKESLYKDLNEQFQNNFFTIVQNDLVYNQTTNNIIDSIQKNLTSIFYFFIENPNLTKMGFYDSENAHVIKEEFAKRLISILEACRTQNLLNEVDVPIMADSIIGSVERLTLTTLLTNMREPEQLASDITNIYFAKQKELVR